RLRAPREQARAKRLQERLVDEQPTALVALQSDEAGGDDVTAHLRVIITVDLHPFVYAQVERHGGDTVHRGPHLPVLCVTDIAEARVLRQELARGRFAVQVHE